MEALSYNHSPTDSLEFQYRFYTVGLNSFQELVYWLSTYICETTYVIL